MWDLSRRKSESSSESAAQPKCGVPACSVWLRTGGTGNRALSRQQNEVERVCVKSERIRSAVGSSDPESDAIDEQEGGDHLL